MSPLADMRFLKMNGLGNEIVVLDLRGARARVTADEARAIAAQPSSRFDQLMVLHDPARRARTLSSASTTPMARRPGPAATARAASPGR